MRTIKFILSIAILLIEPQGIEIRNGKSKKGNENAFNRTTRN